uniref:Uncharacterized protein n=1 Tax=Ditylenchus dipsaci TaxID=166011 RepID=A0A915E5A5_9BILA
MDKFLGSPSSILQMTSLQYDLIYEVAEKLVNNHFNGLNTINQLMKFMLANKSCMWAVLSQFSKIKTFEFLEDQISANPCPYEHFENNSMKRWSSYSAPLSQMKVLIALLILHQKFKPEKLIFNDVFHDFTVVKNKTRAENSEEVGAIKCLLSFLTLDDVGFDFSDCNKAKLLLDCVETSDHGSISEILGNLDSLLQLNLFNCPINAYRKLVVVLYLLYVHFYRQRFPNN